MVWVLNDLVLYNAENTTWPTSKGMYVSAIVIIVQMQI